MIFYMLGLLSYYKLRNKPVPASICLLFFGVITVPPTTTLFFLINKHWIFQAMAFAGGLFCWTFIEYYVHRFVMHGKHYRHYHKSSHFYHHNNPGNIFVGKVTRLILLSAAAVSIICSILFSNYMFLPAGIVTGFTLYSYVHVWLHKTWAVKWLGRLQKFHMRHHFGQTEKCFGVTFTWWDRIFNTAGKAEKNLNANTIELYFGKPAQQALSA